MEAIAVAEGSADLVPELQSLTKKRIQVSNTKKPLYFYVNLAKRYMRQHNDIELSALGMAIATAVTVAEILKKSGLAIQKQLVTSMVDRQDENKAHLIRKAKIEILLEKTENFDDLMTAATTAKEASEDKQEHNDKP